MVPGTVPDTANSVNKHRLIKALSSVQGTMKEKKYTAGLPQDCGRVTHCYFCKRTGKLRVNFVLDLRG